MAFIQLSGISLAFGDRDVLNDINFNLDTASRAALSGPNGSGKSTLMKVMAGLQNADSGDRVVQKGTRVSYLPQSGIVHDGATLREEVELAFAQLHELARRKHELEERLGRVSEGDSDTEQLLLEHHELQEHLLAADFDRREESIQSVLDGLGFRRDDLDRETGEFSGGWQMRIALAKVLLERPDLLLLDEPTNYLDIEARTWLEGWLQRFSGGYLIVSHDRYFLDVTVGEVAELWNGSLKRFKGNYSHYEKSRAQELDALTTRFEAQRAEIEKVEAFVNKFRYNASKAAMVQSRIKYLEKLERIEIPDSMKRIHFHFPPAPHSGKQVLELLSVRKSYGENRVLRGLDLNLARGEKLVIVGRNGAGKSTLMRIAAGVDKDFEGSVRYGTGVTTGYFSQDMESHLDPSLQIVEEIEKDAPTHLFPMLRNLLGAFLFPGDDIFKQISVLSGGEKSRVALLKLLLYPSNLLILDEPTNHLDLRSKDVLLEALTAFTGTLLFVSHDRYFIESLATSVLELGPGGPRLFPGDYDYYLWKTEGDGATATRPQSAAAPAGSTGADGRATGESGPQKEPAVSDHDPRADVPPPREGGATGSTAAGDRPQQPASRQQGMPKAILQKKGTAAGYGEQKRIKSEIRRLEREQSELLGKLDDLERSHRNLSDLLADPEIYTDGTRVKEAKEELDRNTAEQQRVSKRWEEVEAELASMSRG